MKTTDTHAKRRFDYLNGLRKKLDDGKELTEREKDALFHALREGGYKIIRERNGDGKIDFSDYLHRYMWWSGDRRGWEEWGKCYAPDKDTIARRYKRLDYIHIVTYADFITTTYCNGKFHNEESDEDDLGILL